jgi:hypothetical protein
MLTDRRHLAQRFNDKQYRLPDNTYGMVVNKEIISEWGIKVTLKHLMFRNKYQKIVREDHVNLFLHKNYFDKLQIGYCYRFTGLSVEQYSTNPVRFGVQRYPTALKLSKRMQDYSDINI